MQDSTTQARQKLLYLMGLEGKQPEIPVSIRNLEQKAREILSPEAYDYVAGGAGAEDTIRANREAFHRVRIVPRMLRDLTLRNLGIELFGTKLPAPVLLAPIGIQSILHPDAELASARAAAAVGLPFILSTAASRSIEAVAETMQDAPRWFQLYWPDDPDVAASFVSRAEKAGYQAIVVTLDIGILGWRERDLQRAYFPFIRGEGLINYFSDPAFRKSLSQPPEIDPGAAISHALKIFANPSLTWENLGYLRQHTRLPILLKGILHPEDAICALEYHVDGLIVSNHGGRQVDGAIAALDALPGIVSAVQGQIPILFDSGIRSGADALKALALGATAILLGRPYAWGLAVGGEWGVTEVLRNFIADLDATLALSGCGSCIELASATLQRVFN
jgi:lactate 2-monooxygenase